MSGQPIMILGIARGDGERVAEAALQCVGSPFRLHGRDPKNGLDCVGLALHALLAVRAVLPPPDNYTLRGPGRATIMAWADASGLMALPGNEPVRPGDIQLVAPAPGQSHLLVRCVAGFVHAHLGCRKTLAMRGDSPWTVIANWRLAKHHCSAIF